MRMPLPMRSAGNWEWLKKAVTLLVMILSILLAALLAQSPKPKAPGEDWVALYNGKDLTGWVNVGHEKWEPEANGVLHGVAG